MFFNILVVGNQFLALTEGNERKGNLMSENTVKAQAVQPDTQGSTF